MGRRLSKSRAILAAAMPMPEAAVDEDDRFVFRQHNVRTYGTDRPWERESLRTWNRGNGDADVEGESGSPFGGGGVGRRFLGKCPYPESGSCSSFGRAREEIKKEEGKIKKEKFKV
jgi:hypothetical protein